MSDTPAGRLAFRHEGNLWNCYYALPDTMENAIFLGSIIFRAVEQNEERKRAFMEMMKGLLAEGLEEIGAGEVAMWDEHSAPENERTGNA